MNYKNLFLYLLVGVLSIKEINCLHKRCMKCRSRGELGTCGDPFPFNATEPEVEEGIHVVACPSGWCGKMIEGTTGAFRTDDYGAATQRMCLQRSPSDDEERCAYTMWNYRKNFRYIQSLVFVAPLVSNQLIEQRGPWRRNDVKFIIR